MLSFRSTRSIPSTSTQWITIVSTRSRFLTSFAMRHARAPNAAAATNPKPKLPIVDVASRSSATASCWHVRLPARISRRSFASNSGSGSGSGSSSSSGGGSGHFTPSRLFWYSASAVAFFYFFYGLKNDLPFSMPFLLASPFIRFVDGETAHRWGVYVASQGPIVRSFLRIMDFSDADPTLELKLWGLEMSSPVGLAAGFDKDAEAIDGCLGMGFGFVEIGSVTPRPQPGNPKPRVFRLTEDRAVINRYGFNSSGHEAVRARLEKRYGDVDRSVGLVGVNLGKNKTSPSAVDDYRAGIAELGPFADYLVINVSSPNTPGLRDLQRKEVLRDLLSELVKARDEVQKEEQQKLSFPISDCNCEGPRLPLLIKIAPDLTEQQRREIAEVAAEVKVDGIICSNTTISRPESLKGQSKGETGGLSGAPLKDMSTELVRDMYKLTQGQIPIIGVGGIESGKDAYAKIKAGATLVQLYTSLLYFGPKNVPRMKRQLAELVKADGYVHVLDAVGADHRPKATKEEKSKKISAHPEKASADK